jgi:hypothetical protein
VLKVRKVKNSNTVRKLEDSSWLAQIIKDKMDVEFDKNGASARWYCLHTLHIIINEADDKNNSNIYIPSSSLYLSANPLNLHCIPSLSKSVPCLNTKLGILHIVIDFLPL